MPEQIEIDTGPEIGKRTIELDYNLLKNEFDALKKEHDALKADYASKCKYIDDGVRAVLTPWMLANTKFTIEQLDKMPTAEMDRYRSTASLFRTPIAGVGATDNAIDPNSRLTVGETFKYGKDTKEKLYDKRS